MVFHAMGPAYAGVLAGVLHTVMGPDHLSTIVTLSACQGKEAFWFGVTWAAGHMSGMAVIGLMLFLLNSSYGSDAFEAYEHWANYVIGCMMVAAGGYFLLNSDKHFDKEWRPTRSTCACHSSHSPMEGDAEGAQQDGEHTPLVAHKNGAAIRSAGSALIGFVQGVACPAGIVGLAFLQRFSKSTSEMFFFISMFFLATTLAMGSMAMAYGTLTQKCISSASLGRAVYMTSCSLSVALGIAWIVLNGSGQLEVVLGHSHEGHEHHHHGGVHDHNHEHHGDSMLAVPNLLLLASPR